MLEIKKIQIIKRNGAKVEYDGNKIVRVIERAMGEGKTGVNSEIAMEIEQEIFEEINCEECTSLFTVESLQDLIQVNLMKHKRYNTATRFIEYRKIQTNERKNEKKFNLLSKTFLSNYKHLNSPMTQLGSLVYSRTYSRFLPELERREFWWETVARAVDYNCSLVNTTISEAEELFDNVFNLRQFLSGRTFWVGGTKVANNYPMSNYNCSFIVIDNFNAYRDLFYLLMIGSGAGVRVLKEDVAKLPRVRTDVDLINMNFSPVNKNDRQNSTSLLFEDNIVEIIVGDSKEGWVQSLDYFLEVLYSNEYRHIDKVIMNYNNVRPKGEKLKTFGGTASGHIAILDMFIKIDKLIKKHTDEILYKLKPVDCLDIANMIGEGVVVGGVRRTAEIGLVDADDDEAIDAKSGLYHQVGGKWIVNKDIIHRQMSNNSICYKSKPTRERLKWQLEKMRYSGEPGWVNAEAGEKRRPNFNGVNPCGEILLDSKGLCNLTTINVFAFVVNGKLDENKLYRAQRLSARASYRMTTVELELSAWNEVQQRDKLLGCSLTGWQDMINATNITKEDEIRVLKELNRVANEEAKIIAKETNQNEPLLVCTVKPEGTLSQLPTVSSGVHYSHSEYYIRRIRINKQDPLAKMLISDGDYIINPEVGQTWENCTTVVVEYPVKSPQGRTKYDVSALEQLENYKMFMENYVDHNCSITIHVRNNEWEAVEQWVWDNWDETVALSFLSLDDNFYELLPYEAIDETEYNRRFDIIKNKVITPYMIAKFEVEEEEIDMGTEGCEAGVCPVR